jgi:hypothetical protein
MSQDLPPDRLRRAKEGIVKLLLEILIAIVLHPLAIILTWINILGRSDLSGTQKFLWMVICLIWIVGPILYVLVGDGSFW